MRLEVGYPDKWPSAQLLPRHTLVVDDHPATTQLPQHASIAVAPTMIQHHGLNRRAHFHVFLHRHPRLKTAIETGPAHGRQLAQLQLQRYNAIIYRARLADPVSVSRWQIDCERRDSKHQDVPHECREKECEPILKVVTAAKFAVPVRGKWTHSGHSFVG